MPVQNDKEAKSASLFFGFVRSLEPLLELVRTAINWRLRREGSTGELKAAIDNLIKSSEGGDPHVKD